MNNLLKKMLVVISQDSNLPTLIEYGRVFENIFLKIREKGIAIHPMTQMLEEESSKKQVPKELGLAGEVQWVLRIRISNLTPRSSQFADTFSVVCGLLKRDQM